MSKALRIALKNDIKYQRNVKSLLDIDKHVDSWMEEVQSLHVRRGVRALKSTSLLENSQRIAIDTDIDDMVVRARVTEIQMRALEKILLVDENLDRLRKYIRFKYANLMPEKMNMTDRKALIDDRLHDVVKAKKRLEGVMKMGDLVKEDCDQASYGLKRINDMLIARQKER